MASETPLSVRQLAKMAGVSARTLHYYDQIGLLKPGRNPSNGYRRYERPALLRLQQILFLRELGLSLEQIQGLLDQPDFDLLQALQRHREALLQRQERLATLQHTAGHIYLDLGDAMPYGPASPQAQSGVARWHQNMRYFYEPSKEILLGLADGYNDDPDFNATFTRIHPELASFMRQAVQVYCKNL